MAPGGSVAGTARYHVPALPGCHILDTHLKGRGILTGGRISASPPSTSTTALAQENQRSRFSSVTWDVTELAPCSAVQDHDPHLPPVPPPPAPLGRAAAPPPSVLPDLLGCLRQSRLLARVPSGRLPAAANPGVCDEAGTTTTSKGTRT